MPLTDFCKLRLLRRAGTNPSSPSSLGRWPRPPSGSYSEAPSPLRERFRAASRAASDLDDPVAGSSHLRGFARPRYRLDRATTERVAPPVCSDDRRARVRGPREGRRVPGRERRFQIALASGACALKGHTRTTLPSSASSGHPLSPVLAPTREETPADDVDRPRPAFHRLPAKGTGFPQAGMPFTVTLRPLSTGSRLREVRRRPPAHAAQHVFPRLGKGALMGIASATLRSPAMHGFQECEHLFYLLVLPCPGLTTQARQQARTARPSAEQVVPHVPTPAAVP